MAFAGLLVASAIPATESTVRPLSEPDKQALLERMGLSGGQFTATGNGNVSGDEIHSGWMQAYSRPVRSWSGLCKAMSFHVFFDGAPPATDGDTLWSETTARPVYALAPASEPCPVAVGGEYFEMGEGTLEDEGREAAAEFVRLRQLHLDGAKPWVVEFDPAQRDDATRRAIVVNARLRKVDHLEETDEHRVWLDLSEWHESAYGFYFPGKPAPGDERLVVMGSN